MEFPTTPPWWTTDVYDVDSPVLTSLYDVDTVKVYSGGNTQPGWGLLDRPEKDGKPFVHGYMWQREHHNFDAKTTAWAYERHQMPFAYIMRSVPFICVDIDGKNDGFANLSQLGELPPTLAETSKSGNGLHLFYFVDEPWDDVTGYGRYDDAIGIATGIDIRAVGCVYHYPTQRWNHREVAPIPPYLADLLAARREKREAQTVALKDMKGMDEVDLLIAQHHLLEELAKPIAAGKRNISLFAVGSQLAAAAVPDWDTAVRERGDQIGLPSEEVERIIANIVKANP